MTVYMTLAHYDTSQAQVPVTGQDYYTRQSVGYWYAVWQTITNYVGAVRPRTVNNNMHCATAYRTKSH